MHHDWRADLGPVPEPDRIVEVHAKAAVAAGVAPHARPVVVVKRGAVGGKILGEEHILDVVATWRIARDAETVARHRLVRDPTPDLVGPNRSLPGRDTVDRQRRGHRPITFVGCDDRWLGQVGIDPLAAVVSGRRTGQPKLIASDVLASIEPVPGAAVAFHLGLDHDREIVAARSEPDAVVHWPDRRRYWRLPPGRAGTFSCCTTWVAARYSAEERRSVPTA